MREKPKCSVLDAELACVTACVRPCCCGAVPSCMTPAIPVKPRRLRRLHRSAATAPRVVMDSDTIRGTACVHEVAIVGLGALSCCGQGTGVSETQHFMEMRAH